MLSFLPAHWFLDNLSKDSIFSFREDTISINIKDIWIHVHKHRVHFSFSKTWNTVCVSSIHSLYGSNIPPDRVNAPDMYALLDSFSHENLTVETTMEKITSLSEGVLIPTLVDGKLSVTDNQSRFRVEMGSVTIITPTESHEIKISSQYQGEFSLPNGSTYTYDLTTTMSSPNLFVTESKPSDEWDITYSLNYFFGIREIVAIKCVNRKNLDHVITINRNKQELIVNNGSKIVVLPQSITTMIETANTPEKMVMASIHAIGIANSA